MPDSISAEVKGKKRQIETHDAARYVLTIKPEMPIILCTGFSDRLSPETARETDIKAFLKKPVARTEFRRTVRGVLDGESFIFK